MPWCPKCTTEYKEGVRICADCGSELEDELKVEATSQKEMLFSTPKEETADKFIEYLTYSGIHSGEKVVEEGVCWHVTVAETDRKEAARLYTGFYITEGKETTESKDQTKTEEDFDIETLEEDQKEALKNIEANELISQYRSSSSSVYVKKEVKYQDYKFSAYTFFIFGVVGLVAAILNYVGILQLYSSPLSQVIMTIVFIAFIGIGISSLKKANLLKLQIGEEDTVTSSLQNWLTLTITTEYLASISDPAISEELNYMNQMETIIEMTVCNFPDADANLIDTLVEDHLIKILN